MTVCVSAFAANLKAVVCVADKALSYGDHIQWDSDSSKILRLNPSGTLVMFSGSEEHTSKVLANFISVSDQFENKKKLEILKLCEVQYRDAIDEMVEAKFLTPRLLKRPDYLKAISGTEINDYMKSVAKDIDKFEMDCGFLVCGFDVNRTPFIVNVEHPGIATDFTVTGHHAIGCGWDKAVSQLLFSEHKREHEVARVLYDAFDAKAHAEMAQGVGYEWDAVVSIGGVIGFCDISKEIKDLIEKIWAQFNRSPFEKFNEKEDIPLPPKKWRKKLEDLINSQVISKVAKMEADIEASEKKD